MIPIPHTFKGRPVTNRGVHMAPTGQWGAFMADPDAWIERLLGMGMSWVMALTDSDSFAKQGAAEVLLSAGILPIVRFNISGLPEHFTHQDATAELVAIYDRHGAPCLVQYLNEPGDPREWKDGKVPADWWSVWTSRWREGARQIAERGAYPVLPDGPCYDRNPFPDCSLGIENLFADGLVAYGGHYYALNRPLDYPYDDAQRFGVQLSEAEYRAALDDFADDPNWNQDPTLATLNEARARLQDPDLTALDDDTCWRGWEKVEYWMETFFGFSLVHLMTEGGVTPRARAGSGPNNELRYVLPTPKAVARTTLEMYETPSPLVAMCPWVLASDALGATGWYDDTWFGGNPWGYGFEKPVVEALRQEPPVDPVRALIEGARADIARARAVLGG